MTTWFRFRCDACGAFGPPAFVLFNGAMSVYPLSDADRAAAGAWLEEHAAHLPTVLHEDCADDARPIPPR